MKEVITKYLEGKATTSEQQELMTWLRDRKNFREYRQVKRDWKKSLTTTIMDKDTETGLLRFQSHIMKDEFVNLIHIMKWQRVYKYAASILLVAFLVGGAYFMNEFRAEPLYTSVIADHGQISKVVLPDHSEVWLNSGTQLTYSNHFGRKERFLDLEGQAFFDIRHDAEVPLVVKSANLNVKVLGTKFEVKAYSGEENVSVILQEGSVEMFLPQTPDDKMRLKPGEMAVYNIADKKIELKKVAAENYTAWRKGILNLYDVSLDEVARILERRFNYKFRVNDQLQDVCVTLSIEQEELDDVIRILKTITPLKITHVNDTIVFDPRKRNN